MKDQELKEIYFDNAATTKADDKVIEEVCRVMRYDYGNPSSKHMKGVEAENLIKESKKTIADILKIKDKEIIFTSGGTESNNLAIKGAAQALNRSGKHIITSKTEHDSVLKVFEHLGAEGFEVTYINVDENGYLNTDELKNAIREDTILVSIMYVNNETGTVQDIKNIGKLIKEINPRTVFHVDAVQAFGKYDIYPKKENIDLLSVSAHKIYGPKGVGFLYVNEKVRLIPQILGGGQQKGMRSGTDNVPGICGLSLAAFDQYDNRTIYRNISWTLKHYFIRRLLDISLPSDSDGCEEDIKIKLRINSLPEDLRKHCLSFEEDEFYIEDIEHWEQKTSPNIVSVTFDKVKSEVLLHALEEKGIYVSSGSACASNRNEISHTLSAMGFSKADADSTLRFSFSKYNTKDEIEYTISQLKELIPVLSKFVSR